MNGTGVPVVTPFTEAGEVDTESLSALVRDLEDRGVDFVVPVGSTGESVLLSAAEQERVIGVVAEAASVPVLAGTGQPGLALTVRATARARAAGADAAMVVTPYYFRHDQETLARYYRDLADAVELPVYAYSIPSLTGIAIEPETVGDIAGHEAIAGMKDSSGDLERFAMACDRTAGADFDLLVGHGGLYAHALETGAAGGILALANVAPELACDVYSRFADGDVVGAMALGDELVALNHAITAGYGVAGLKAAMRLRGFPAGHVRAPHRPVGPDTEAELAALVDDLGLP